VERLHVQATKAQGSGGLRPGRAGDHHGLVRSLSPATRLFLAGTLDAILELAPIVRELLDHLVGSARRDATCDGPEIYALTDVVVGEVAEVPREQRGLQARRAPNGSPVTRVLSSGLRSHRNRGRD
jgi:hypothetical protein